MKLPPMKQPPKRDAVDKSAPKPKPWYTRPSWVSKPKPKPKPFEPTARADTWKPDAVYRSIREIEESMAPDSPPPPSSLPKIKMSLRPNGALAAPPPPAAASQFSFEMAMRPKIKSEDDNTNIAISAPPPPATASPYSFDVAMRPKIKSEDDDTK